MHTESGDRPRYICLQAVFALRVMDEESAIAKLRLALPLGAKHGFERAASEYMFRRTSTDLCAFALKHGIETVYVKRVIRSQRLCAPSPEISGKTQPQTTLQQPNAGK